MEFSGPLNFEDASETEPQQNNNSRQTLHVSANGSMEPTVKKEMEIVQKLSVKHEVLKNVLEAEKMMQDLVSIRQEYGSTVVASQNERNRKSDHRGFAVQYHNNHHIINIPEEIEPDLEPEWCIYKVPTSLFKVKEMAYTPLLISIGPVHHNKEELKEMQEQKQRYFKLFRKRIKNELGLGHYQAFLEQEEQNLRGCYQKKFSDISKEKFVEMMQLDAVFIMELFLREAKRWEHKKDYLVTQRCVSKSIQRDLMLLENQLPIIVLEKLYDIVPSNDKKHGRFINLAHEYFISYYPHQLSSENKFELECSFRLYRTITFPFIPTSMAFQSISGKVDTNSSSKLLNR
ncbi:UPF0481 protein [Spatholobus suberectus]|nr:UPF0481 protein [Spatholobus suberectus]